jgi:hypothetical protein
MIAIERGQQLTKNDLQVYVRDNSGNLIDPFSITYAIYDRTGSKPVLVGNRLDQQPARESVGFYWANIRIEEADSLGEYEIEWTIKVAADSVKECVRQRFSIVKKSDPLQMLSSTGGVAYYPNQFLGPSELYIQVLNERNNPFDPSEITYAVFDRSTGIDILVGSPAQPPVRTGCGRYHANFQIPSNANQGDWIIRWNFKDESTDSERNVVQEFAVVHPSTQVSSPYKERERDLLRRLRFLLRDNNPDRNYRFVPPESERVIQNFTETFGFIWTDEELYEYLLLAMDTVNNYPPLEDHNLPSVPSHLSALVVLKAAAFALSALAINWVHDEFDYSIGGVSLNIDKSSKYQGMSEKFDSEFQTQIDRYKDFGVKVIMGIQQPRYGIGIASALGPYSGRGVQNRRNFIGSYRL